MAPATGESEDGRTRVLIVDDHAAVRDMLVYALRRHGWQAGGAGDGLQALACLQHGAFDVVITDLEMPRLDGLALLREIQRMDHPLPVVVHTSLLDASLVAQLRWAGAYRVLLKGGPIGDLLRSVEEARAASATPAIRRR